MGGGGRKEGSLTSTGLIGDLVGELRSTKLLVILLGAYEDVNGTLPTSSTLTAPFERDLDFEFAIPGLLRSGDPPPAVKTGRAWLTPANYNCY